MMPRKKDNTKKERVVKREKDAKKKNTPVKVDLESIKDEVYKYTDELVRKYYLTEIEKVNRTVIREKNKKILFRNFIITLLLLVIVYLLYLLTTVNYFGRFSSEVDNKDGSNTSKETVSVKDDDKEEEHEPTFNELKEAYGYLIDDIKINEKSKYIKDYYNGNLTDELKNYFALNSLDFKKLDLVDDYNMFSDALIKDSFDRLFNDEYHSVSFDYNGNNVRYISKLNAYLTDFGLEKTKSNIKREITAVEVDGSTVKIVTIEGLIKDGKLYNVSSDEEIGEYNGDSIVPAVERLNKVTYTFNNKKLESIK